MVEIKTGFCSLFGKERINVFSNFRLKKYKTYGRILTAEIKIRNMLPCSNWQILILPHLPMREFRMNVL
jgi:hypothetical protein